MKKGDVVKIKLLNDGLYGDMDHINFPVEVEAVFDGSGYDVPISELVRIGCEPDDWFDMDSAFWNPSEVKL